MNRFLIWVFYRKRFTYCDVMALPVGLIIGGWWGVVAFTALLFVGTAVGHVARWWGR